MKPKVSVIPFREKKIKGKFLVSNLLGNWDFLNEDEYRRLHTYRYADDPVLTKRLYARGLLVDESNVGRLLTDFQRLNSHLFGDTALHIAVVTTQCNLQCAYCQTDRCDKANMTPEVAARVLKYLFDVRRDTVTLELQGGEPLLNWEITSFLISHARKFNKGSKDLHISMVSNLTLLDEDKARFLADHDVDICTSLDGPAHLHDAQRRFRKGGGTYRAVAKSVGLLRKKFGRKVHMLPTITRNSLRYPTQIIDEYLAWGQTEISLRPVSKLGTACARWDSLGYSVEEFLAFYEKSMAYILALNKKGTYFSERLSRVILEKVMAKKDPGYVDLCNPCGAGRSTITYMPDGSCYPCDESRMLGTDFFRLGSILHENYDDMMKKDALLYLLQSSSVTLWDNASVFSPWIGTCPVVNYAVQGNLVPKIACSPLYRITAGQFEYLFGKLAQDDGAERVFSTWIKGGQKSEAKKK